jgi:MurNAc alpha-1-phosphate uridylyltransferase
MNALILAAGRGERMRPLTDTCPKPLLPVRGMPMIEWHLRALARGGVSEVVINTAWLEERFPQVLGDGSRFGLRIHYSMEGRDHGGALDVAGGIAKALPLLGDAFWVVSGDIFAPDFVFDAKVAEDFARSERLAHLWLVPNPPFHPKGDFGIDAQGLATREEERPCTWAAFGLFKPAMFGGLTVGTVKPLLPYLLQAISQRRVSAQMYEGRWENVGTPAQLAALQATLSS